MRPDPDWSRALQYQAAQRLAALQVGATVRIIDLDHYSQQQGLLTAYHPERDAPYEVELFADHTSHFFEAHQLEVIAAPKDPLCQEGEGQGKKREELE